MKNYRFKYSEIIGFISEEQDDKTFKITVILKGNTVVTFLSSSKVDALRIALKFDINCNALILKKKWFVINAK